MADELVAVVVDRLLRIRDELGERVYRDAARAALVSIGRAALAESERIASAGASSPGQGLVRFPLARAVHRSHLGPPILRHFDASARGTMNEDGKP